MSRRSCRGELSRGLWQNGDVDAFVADEPSGAEEAGTDVLELQSGIFG